MIIQCQGCAAKYFLPEDKVPDTPMRVRCPKCQAVFTLVPRAEPIGAAVTRRGGGDGVDVAETPPVTSPERSPSDAAAPAGTARRPRGRGKEDRAKRLARVLVSDILIYNRDKRDQALAEGNLMTVLAEEIRKSWELYKEKVGPEVASSTNYFKEALNEILADGQQVF